MSATQRHLTLSPLEGSGRVALSVTILSLLIGTIQAEDAAPAPAGNSPPVAPQTPVAPAPAASPSDLQKRVDTLESEVHQLESEHDQSASSTPGGKDAGQPAFVWGAYGELKFGANQNPANNGQWQNGFDGGRLTFLPSYQVNDMILFKAEVEFEHGGISLDNDDKLAGTVEIEQAYFDVAFNEHLHWRPPGIDVVPFGYTNLYHEPTLFYSVQRTELANGLIPTTWYEGASSIHGVLAGPVTYQFQVSTSLVDDGGNVQETTEANTPPVGGYPPGIDGQNGLANSRSTTSDFLQETSNLGYALRLAYSIPSVHGLDGSTSVYVAPNIEERGSYATTAAGDFVGPLGHVTLTMEDTEMRFRPDQEGIELRAELVGVQFSNPGQMRANNDQDPTNNVGRNMWGYSGEAAWHQRLGNWDVVPFVRYTQENLQTGYKGGLDANGPNGSGQLQFYTVGLATFPVSQVVFKADYQYVRDHQPQGAQSSQLLGGVGFFF